MKILRPYQLPGVRYLRANSGGALFWEMRLGKTLVTIRWAKQYPSDQRLVIAPYSALRGWANELHDERQAYTRLDGTGQMRRVTFESGAYDAWLLVNIEIWRTVPRIFDILWDLVIIDESTCIMNPQAKVTKYAQRIQAKKKVILAGIPAPKTPLDYYSQLHFVNPAILEDKTYWHFRAKRFQPDQSGFRYIVRLAQRQWLEKRLAAHCSFLRRSDVGWQSGETVKERGSRLPKVLLTQYKELDKDFWTEVQGEIYKTKWAGAKYCTLRQLASGFFQGELVSTHKLDDLLYLLEYEFPQEQVVIWAWYRPEVLAIAQRIKRSQVIHGDISQRQRESSIADFQSGKYSRIVIQPETQKFGRDLSAASTQVFFSNPDSYLTKQQVRERIVKLDKSTLTLEMVTEGTIDEDILAAHKAGKSFQQFAIDKIRSRNN